ncbi:MAG: c-type cytochrome [Mariprofundaceae bacterium]|nr:c-type cytochrome [Mariprofundaceae bacterium]
MRSGDKLIAGLLGLVFVAAIGKGVYDAYHPIDDKGIPFYSTLSEAEQRKGADLYRDLSCRNCHVIWAVKNVMETVPAPSLDGIGSLRSEAWLYRYFSAKDPQTILPTRLKKKYTQPSYASLSEEKRRFLAKYFASLKVKDWYLQKTKAAEYKKLTGNVYMQQTQAK